MAYPTSLDSITDAVSGQYQNNPNHVDQHAVLNNAVEQLEVKVGITDSTDNSSLVYKTSGIVNPSGDTTGLTDVINIQKAIDSNDRVLLGGGDFYLGGKNGSAGAYYLLLIDKSKKIEGAGMNSTNIYVKSTVDNVTDVIRIAPDNTSTVNTQTKGMYISDFHIYPESTTCARHAIHLDLTNTTGYGLSDLRLKRVGFNTWTSTAWNGNDFYMTNPTLFDGLYTSSFEENDFNCGIYFNKLGDSVHFIGNHFAGEKVGCTIASMSGQKYGGASTVVFDRNNGWAKNAVLVLNGERFKITNNNFEAIPGGTVGRAVIEINGGYYTLGAATNTSIINTITDNVIVALDVNSYGLYLDNCIYTTIDRNLLRGNRSSAASQDLFISSTCDYTYIGKAEVVINGTIYTQNNGTNTIYL